MFKLLLVDDSEDDIALMFEALKDSKLALEIVTAKNGQLALDEIASHGCPDLILLDINMPLMNGKETLEKIRANPKTKHIPIVMLTTSRVERDVLESYQLGASAYVSKPLDFEKFQDIVGRIGEFFFTMISLPPHSEQ